jgi:hypothetical protein
MTPNKPFKINNKHKEVPDNRTHVPMGAKVCSMCKTIHNISPIRIMNRFYCMKCFAIAKKIKELNVPRKRGRTLHIPRFEDEYFNDLADDPEPAPERIIAPIIPEELNEVYEELLRKAREKVVPKRQYKQINVDDYV